MDKKNRYCKGYTAWLAHANKPKKGQVVIGYDEDTGAPIYGDNWTGGSGAASKTRTSTSKDHGVMYVNEDDGSTWRAGSGTVGGNVMRPSDNDKIMDPIRTARGTTSQTHPQSGYDIRNTTGRNRTVSKSNTPTIGPSGGSGWKAYDTETTYKSTPDGQIMQITKTKNNVTGAVSSSARKVSPGQLTEIGGKPSSWNPSSSEYKKWKKDYNARYYRENKDYWRKYYGVKNPIVPSSATSNSYRDDAYKQAAEARSRAQYDRANYDGRSNAQKMLDRSARDTGSERVSFGKELFNAKSRLNDMWAEGAGSIASAGKSFIKNWTSGASSISGGAKNARTSFNDMWSNGASTIANAGKSFIKNWMAGIGR